MWAGAGLAGALIGIALTRAATSFFSGETPKREVNNLEFSLADADVIVCVYLVNCLHHSFQKTNFISPSLNYHKYCLLSELSLSKCL